MLNLAVRPQKGKALLFFPAFADGTSDPRWASCWLLHWLASGGCAAHCVAAGARAQVSLTPP